MSQNESSRLRFHPGQIVATRGALEALRTSGQSPYAFLGRHLRGDWGNVCDDDRRLNDLAVEDGSRLLSAYETSKGDKLWIITEGVNDDGRRASTCILLPQEY